MRKIKYELIQISPIYYFFHIIKFSAGVYIVFAIPSNPVLFNCNPYRQIITPIFFRYNYIRKNAKYHCHSRA